MRLTMDEVKKEAMTAGLQGLGRAWSISKGMEEIRKWMGFRRQGRGDGQ
jgi:hypothetical protein